MRLHNTQPWVFLIGLVGGISSAPAQTPATNAVPEKKPRWASFAEAGLTLARGNSETLLATARIGTGKKWDKNEISLGAGGAYGETKDQTTGKTTVNTEMGNVFGQYNRLFTERLYGYARAEGFHDGVADIEYRVTLSPGVGYYFVKNKATLLSTEIGPGYVLERKGGQEEDYATIRFGEKFEHKFNDRVRIWEAVEYLPQVEDFSNFILNAEIGIESSLSKALNLRIYVVETYNSVPAAGRKKNDAKLVAALAVRF
jgi:putative salt-induced outer membrane protein YdiY